jgi:hypothetical protein
LTPGVLFKAKAKLRKPRNGLIGLTLKELRLANLLRKLGSKPRNKLSFISKLHFTYIQCSVGKIFETFIADWGSELLDHGLSAKQYS